MRASVGVSSSAFAGWAEHNHLIDSPDDLAPVSPLWAVPPAAPAADRGTVVVPTAAGGVLALDEIALEDDGTVSNVQHLEVGEAGLFGAYGAIVDDAGRRSSASCTAIWTES